MPLKLTITSLSGGERQERTLSKGTLSIGRGSGNDWVLPDPDQHLSRTHCMLSYEQGQYWLTDLSTNGMLLNGARTPTVRDSRTVLTDGDSILLGGYKLLIAEVEDRAVSGGRDPFAVSGSDDFNDPLNVDPLADPLSDPLSDALAGRPDFHHPVAHQAPVARMADPFDSADKGRPRDPAQDLFQGQTPVDSWTGPAQRDDAAAGSHAFSAPRSSAPTPFDDIDFDALLGDVMPQASHHPLAPGNNPVKPAATPVTDPFDSLLGEDPFASPATLTPAAPAVSSTPYPSTPPSVAPLAPPPSAPPAPVPSPAVLSVPVATSTPAPVPVSAPASPSHGALLAAFFEGTGIAMAEIPPADQEAAMKAVGALFRAFVSGTRDVLMSRAEIKHEMRVEQTMIRSRDNNALKFSVSPEEALQALLRPNRPGYKAPLAAVEEAFDDIRSHELAVMAGMQTGLMALLKRFDPALLEGRLQKGMLDSILPSARKARFWEMFCAAYKDIAREAEDDFHALFGREFARAYTAQVSKL
jgi:type VI secretion system protein